MSSPVIHTPDSDWVFDTFEDGPSIWDDARGRQVRTPDNLDHENAPIKSDDWYQPDIDAWCNPDVGCGSIPDILAGETHFEHVPVDQPVALWPEFNSNLPLPEKRTETTGASHRTSPVTTTAHSAGNPFGGHRCTESRHAGNFGCADFRLRIVHDTSYDGYPHLFPGRFQGVVDFQVCEKCMTSHLPGWEAMKNEEYPIPGAPINIYVTSDLETAKYAAKWLFDQIHYTSTEASTEYIDMRTVSSVVELAAEFGGAGPRIDGFIRWALLNAEVSSLEETIFGLHAAAFSASNYDLFSMFQPFLALNFTGGEVSNCLKKLSTVAPYLPYVLHRPLFSNNVVRRRIVHIIMQIVERAIDEAWQEPIDVARFHFLCALKYRFMSQAALTSDSFDLSGLMHYMREVVLVHKEPYGQLLADFRSAFTGQGLNPDFSPLSLLQHYN
ncbi:hypothetical protein SPBR_01557 [Sporothrix brasiliensis 5110]|uniref:Uncharacterized protein n=1 Tax=Sporothrix brasiliensis 5110 TaxID=1398154 RepID=A0A0C2J1X7_9PEZI|nr:uncharacterized protein SPBR_01557 [Sporothrix brasiliensis 5110]KIH91102.1 hypothetical protein SPBR_01557 [Sporothrix brasiliensis 5110]